MTNRNLVAVADSKNIPEVINFPAYDRTGLKAGIGHLGMGGFHRAHQASAIEQLLQSEARDWMIHGVSMLEADRELVAAMNTQNNLYTLTERSGEQDTLKVIGAIKEATLAPAQPDYVVRSLSSPDIKIVSLTVTEKGYYYTAQGDLDAEHNAVQHDLEAQRPATMLGYLFAIAGRRRQTTGAPFTVMSCDNIPGNGNLTQRLILQFAERKDPAVGRWIEQNVSFPNSMVDRITPAVTPETKVFVRDNYGISDACPVISESYWQWVIEDNFINGRPDFEQAGAQIVRDVEPYENLKTRMLNGSHSAIAYMSYLLGHRTVSDAVHDPLVNAFMRRYMDENVTPTIPDLPGIDLEDYKQTLLARFANPSIGDTLQRIAMDGSTKIRAVIVPPLAEQLKSNGSIRWMAFALAAWTRYLSGVDESGRPITIDDPIRDELREIKGGADVLRISQIFSPELAGNKQLACEINEAYDAICKHGTQTALSRWLAI